MAVDSYMRAYYYMQNSVTSTTAGPIVPNNYRGTYLGLRPRPQCAEALGNWCKIHKIPSTILPVYYHVSILESEVPDLDIEPKPVNFLIPPERVTLLKFGTHLVAKFSSSTINARRKELLPKEAAAARSKLIIMKPRIPYVSHLTLSDYARGITDSALEELNSKWNLPLLFGQEFVNPLHLKKPIDYAPNPNMDPDKDRMIAMRDRILRLRGLK